MSETYRPGELDQRVTITRDIRTPDGRGGFTVTSETVAERWAHVRPRSAKEGYARGQVQDTAMYLCVLRTPVDLRAADTIIWNGEAFNVRGILSRGRSLYVEADMERGVAL